MRRYVELTPAIPLVAATRGVTILATRFALPASDSELHRTAFFREIMQPQGWRHGAVLCFWTEPAASFPILVLTLYRTLDQPDFSDQELALLDHLHAFLAPAVTHFHQICASSAVSDGMAMALRRLSRGVAVLDWQLRVVQSNLAARRWCAQWNQIRTPPCSQGQKNDQFVPDCLLEACRELREELSYVLRRDGESATKRRRHIVSPASPGLRASVTVICQSAAIAEPSFVIEFEAAPRASTRHDDPASVLTRLTPSEREVALVVSEGLSNEETAERLGKTIHAVKFLLHRIYRKLDVPNRARLSLLLVGRAGSPAI